MLISIARVDNGSRRSVPGKIFTPEKNHRSLNGQNAVTGSGTSSQLNTAGPVKESNVRLVDPTPAYPGIRYVFNVLDSTAKSYGQAAYFYGFGTDDGSTFKSPLCNGSKASTLTNFGFGPLDTTVSDNNPAGSTCRLYTP